MTTSAACHITVENESLENEAAVWPSGFPASEPQSLRNEDFANRGLIQRTAETHLCSRRGATA